MLLLFVALVDVVLASADIYSKELDTSVSFVGASSTPRIYYEVRSALEVIARNKK